MQQAEIETVVETYAICPKCNEHHSVMHHETGDIECACGLHFEYNTEH